MAILLMNVIKQDYFFENQHFKHLWFCFLAFLLKIMSILYAIIFCAVPKGQRGDRAIAQHLQLL